MAPHLLEAGGSRLIGLQRDDARLADENQPRANAYEERHHGACSGARNERIVDRDDSQTRCAAHRRKEKERRHCLPLPEADVDKSVRKVVATAAPDRSALGQANEDHEGRVEYR
jgi:hypothetical protein